MEDSARNLAYLLERQSLQCRNVLEILEAEREAILAARPGDLSPLGERKERCLREIAALERQREAHVRRILQIDDQAPVPRLSRIAEIFPEAVADGLRSQARALHAAIRRIEEANRSNRMLIHHALHVVREAQEHLARLSSPRTVYSSCGKISPNGFGGRLILRSA